MEIDNNKMLFVQAEPIEELEQESPRISMILILALLLGLFIAWAANFEFDTTIRASGKLIPRARTQIIQVADGGVLSQILVREGATVKDGELLAVLEKERASANYEEENARVIALEIALLRAQAEVLGINPKFENFTEESFDIVDAQQKYFSQRKLNLEEQLFMLESSFELVTMELEMNERLLITGDASRIEVMRARREVNTVQEKMMEARNTYLDEAHQEIIRTEAELSSLRYKLGAANSVLNHTEIISPVGGVVKYLTINTLGGVLRSGDELMQISPFEGGLIIEAQVKPADIGQLQKGMSVFIKLDAFDYSIYGNLMGTLEYISSDTLTEQDASGRESVFYSVQIRVDEEYMQNEPKLADVVLKAGMNVTIDIKTGSKTILNYLSKPITKTFSGAVH